MNQDRYECYGEYMLIFKHGGEVDVMVRDEKAIYTLTTRGVAKHLIEKGDDL